MSVTGKDEERVEAIALERFMLERTVPLLTEQTKDGFPALLGTSTLLDVHGTLFLVTADHVLEDIMELGEVAFPESPRGKTLWSLGSCTLHRVDNMDLDLAILEIRSSETNQRLRAGWKTVTEANLAAPQRGVRSALCGYPAEYTTRRDDLLHGKLLTIYTAQLPELPESAEPPVNEAFDLFYLCDNSAENLFGGPGELPRLGGTSGSSIWEIGNVAETEPWTPERALRIVGVNRTYRPGKYFRGRPWWLVAKMLSQHEKPEVAAEGELLVKRLAPPWS